MGTTKKVLEIPAVVVARFKINAAGADEVQEVLQSSPKKMDPLIKQGRRRKRKDFR